ncbi:hypothetical protein NEOLEDRAFT_1132434 [Neolentinus lepideus HHB14362 ss-1]|uniref:Uncharacterized protein n=1 Tax=Neolentinus lepideus HHB14362 ss-1 TaxID=1314782 RepID=A0A165TAI0_9AGAM|nr:hypothetical protein NEOLEDRAFT_1132434 [Neolentinus lepideus HHB14362 ss-1]
MMIIDSDRYCCTQRIQGSQKRMKKGQKFDIGRVVTPTHTKCRGGLTLTTPSYETECASSYTAPIFLYAYRIASSTVKMNIRDGHCLKGCDGHAKKLDEENILYLVLFGCVWAFTATVAEVPGQHLLYNFETFLTLILTRGN